NWQVDLATRSVVALVLDTTQPAEDDRARLYVDGVLQPLDLSMQPLLPLPANDTIVIGASDYVCVGNRFSGGRTLQGAIYYAAYYGAALTEAELRDNA